MKCEPHITRLNSPMKFFIPVLILEHMQILFLCSKCYFIEWKEVVVQGKLRLHSVETNLGFVSDLCMIENIWYHIFLISVLADPFKCTGAVCAIWLHVVPQSYCLILRQNNPLNQYRANIQTLIAKPERKKWNNLLPIILTRQVNWFKFCCSLQHFGSFPVELLYVYANITEIISLFRDFKGSFTCNKITGVDHVCTRVFRIFSSFKNIWNIFIPCIYRTY